MRRTELWIWVLFTGSTLLVLFSSNHVTNITTGLKNCNNENLELTRRGMNKVITTSRRKLKEKNRTTARPKTKMNPRNFNVEDYPHFDPTPSSRANIRNGPIEHGTPLRPYIPRPTPPAPGPGHESGSAPGPLNPPDLSPPRHLPIRSTF